MSGAFMLDNITFIDLVALTRITPEATVERFGGLINSSFFDASNILGTLKQKGLVDFVTSFPTQSAITVTEQGKQVIAEVQEKSTAAFDTLDMAVLVQISSGKRNLADLTGGVNVTSKDLAIHLYKLSIQQFISYELRNGNMNITLTEKGFLRVKEGMPRPEPPPMPQPQAPQEQQQPQQPPLQPVVETQPSMPGAVVPTPQPQAQPQKPKMDAEMNVLDAKIRKEKMYRMIIIAVLIVVIIGFVFYLHTIHLI